MGDKGAVADSVPAKAPLPGFIQVPNFQSANCLGSDTNSCRSQKKGRGRTEVVKGGRTLK